ncbi:RluA family pseudouridine synthase [Bacillus timonensis]|nr:RluA family pseudouridine synthase [Bacillus timonensis]
MNSFTIDWAITAKDEGKSIKEFLTEQDISRASLTDIKFGGGQILVNRESVTVRYQLKKGDDLKVVFPTETPSIDLLPEEIPLDIVFEDDYVLVINKRPYMNTIPSREHRSGSLANALLSYYKKIGLVATIHVVNRLDRDTSGLLTIAKHRHVHHLFSRLQKNAAIKRRYVAIVHGLLDKDEGMISAPIGRKTTSIIEREVREDGQHAVTHFSVKSRLNDATYVSLQLETGRTHQIRVHMSHLGHPLVGDELYGGKREFIRRQALHCTELEFVHPVTGEGLHFQKELPQDMMDLLESFKG